LVSKNARSAAAGEAAAERAMSEMGRKWRTEIEDQKGTFLDKERSAWGFGVFLGMRKPASI
jgi:hypothetical protein